jgi:hypothetical protein
MFRAMLDDANLARSSGWLARARTWRLALLQEPDGGWGASAGLAGVLAAADDEVGPCRLTLSNPR